MTVRYFCDICDAEIRAADNRASSRIRGHKRGDKPLTIEVMAGAGYTMNSGQLCTRCVLDAVVEVASRLMESERAS